MKKNPGRKDRRFHAKKNRTYGGKPRMRWENWKRHFLSIRRRNKRNRQKRMSELAKQHLYGNKRYERVTKISDAPALVED